MVHMGIILVRAGRVDSIVYWGSGQHIFLRGRHPSH